MTSGRVLVLNFIVFRQYKSLLSDSKGFYGEFQKKTMYCISWTKSSWIVGSACEISV